MNRTTATSKLLLIAANLLIPVAVVLFAQGFFPYKPLLPGLARYDDSAYGAPPAAPFDRLVFMVVDALRRLDLPLTAAHYSSEGSERRGESWRASNH